MGRPRKGDHTSELIKEIKDSVTPDEAERLLAVLRAKKAGGDVDNSEVGADTSASNNNGQFAEAEARDGVVSEEVKIVISEMLGNPNGNLNKTILTSEVPNTILIRSVIAKTRSERRSVEYRRTHPNEDFMQTLQKNLYLHLMAHKRGRVDELLRIAELETDKSQVGGMPLSYGQ